LIVNHAETSDIQETARRYLSGALGERAPETLTFTVAFDERPLEGEGPTVLFSFDLPPESAARQATADTPHHFVAVGKTEPNYYPTYGLSADDMYSLHIGTRFMLELGVALVDAANEPPTAREAMRAFVATCNPDVPIEHESLAALFRCGEELFAVYRVTLRGQDVYCFAADCPPGFCESVDAPPQVALRLQLGRVIRAEARHEQRRAAILKRDTNEGAS
jgi:hypothetical protein